VKKLKINATKKQYKYPDKTANTQKLNDTSKIQGDGVIDPYLSDQSSCYATKKCKVLKPKKVSLNRRNYEKIILKIIAKHTIETDLSCAGSLTDKINHFTNRLLSMLNIIQSNYDQKISPKKI